MEFPPFTLVTPTDEQVQDAAHAIRELEPGLGQLKLLARLKEENNWTLSEKRFRRLVPSTVAAGIDAAIAEALKILEEDEDEDEDDYEDGCSSDSEFDDASGESMGYGHYEELDDSDGEDDEADLEAEGAKEGHPGERKAVFTDSRKLADDAFAKQIGWRTRTVRLKWNFKLTESVQRCSYCLLCQTNDVFLVNTLTRSWLSALPFVTTSGISSSSPKTSAETRITTPEA